MGDNEEDSLRGGLTVKRECGADITLKVQRQNEEDVSLKTKGDIPFRRILLDYCHQKGLIYEVIRFVYEGKRIGENQTPDELEMDDGDVIDAWSELIDYSLSSTGVKRECGADITLIVQKPNEEPLPLKTKGDIPFRCILLDFCNQKGLIYEIVRFTYDDIRIREDQTPDELEMDDEDIIDAWCDKSST